MAKNKPMSFSTDQVEGASSFSSLAGWSTPAETPDGATTVFTVGSSAPSDVVADGITYYDGKGYSFAAGQITFDNPPAQYVRYR